MKSETCKFEVLVVRCLLARVFDWQANVMD